jgi:hypothetical protein
MTIKSPTKRLFRLNQRLRLHPLHHQMLRLLNERVANGGDLKNAMSLT